MKRTTSAALLAVGIITFTAGHASAHVPNVSASCDDGAPTGHVTLIKYPPGSTVRIQGGAPIAFSPAYSTTVNLGSPTVAHTFHVVVHSPDHIGELDETEHVAACYVPQTTTTVQATTTTQAATTTTAAATTTTTAATTTTVKVPESGPLLPGPSTTTIRPDLTVPLVPITGPATTPSTAAPLPDDCVGINPDTGIGSRRWSLAPCTDGSVTTARNAPDFAVTPTTTIRSTLPTTGASTGPALALASVTVAGGLGLGALARRRTN